MANAHLTKPSLCSPAAREVNFPKTSFSPATSLRRFAKAIERVSIVRTDISKMNPLVKILKTARILSERWGGFYFRWSLVCVEAAPSDVSKPRTDTFHDTFAFPSAGVGRWALLAVCSYLRFCQTTANAAFPLDEFKEFINAKPTIERLEFRVRSIKHTIKDTARGVGSDTSRTFHLTYQTDVGFSLVEIRTEGENDYPYFFVGRYGDLYWHQMSSNDVVTSVFPAFTQPAHLTAGPHGLAMVKLGIALDAMNLGILDLGNNRVEWDGRKFTCLSNLIGAKIEGELLGDENAPPSGLRMTYRKGNMEQHFNVDYSFEPSASLPPFLPSRIRIQSSGEMATFIVSEYELIKAVFSHRNLALADVDFTKFLTQNSRRFAYSNETLYSFTDFGKAGVRARRVMPGRPKGVHLEAKGHGVLGILVVSTLVFVCVLYRLNKQKKETL